MSEVTVVTISEVAPYSGPDELPGLRFRPLRDAAGVSSWGMSVQEFEPHTDSYPEHDHASDGHEEVYLVLQGAVVLSAGGREYVLRRGQLARVPGDVERRLATRDSAATVLVVGGTPGSAYQPSMGG